MKVFALFALLFFAPLAYGQGTFTAASCNYADINGLINNIGGTQQHLAVNGDTIMVPATANCSFTSVLSFSVCISIIGQGTPLANGAGLNAPVITLPTTQTNAFINNLTSNGSSDIKPATVGGKPCVTRISNISWMPANTTYSPTQVFLLSGACNSTTCPYLRIDHNTFGAANLWWPRTNSNDWRERYDNFYGVHDHNTVFSDSIPWGSPGNPSWNGVGGPTGCGNSSVNGCGDQSWASPSTFGTALDVNGVPKSFYYENDIINFLNPNNVNKGSAGWLADCTNAACRRVERFNTVNNGHTDGHGTETGGRFRGQYGVEIYGNTYNMDCSRNGGSGINAYLIARSGNAFGFGNTLGKINGPCASQPWQVGIQLETFRISGNGTYTAFGDCDGTSGFDKNDNASLTGQSTFTAVASPTFTDTTQTWTANQFAPVSGGKIFMLFDPNVGSWWDIISNTACPGTCSITVVNARLSNYGVAPKVGDPYYIAGTNAYVYSTATATTTNGTLVDSSQSGIWTLNQYVGYSVHDTVVSSGNQILSNTTTGTASFVSTNDPNSGSAITITSGDHYAITRATVCTDQAGRTSGAFLGGQRPQIVLPVNQAASPAYEFMDSFTGTPAPSSIIGLTPATNANTVSNRDYYAMALGQGIQTSPTSPFDGLHGGIGWGAFANIPTSCTPGASGEAGVGYWAEDQGNWNNSTFVFPDGSSQGQLFVCKASNVSPVDVNGAATTCTAAGSNFWCLWYTPAPYPHPLVSPTSGLPIASFSPSPVNFGNVNIGCNTTVPTTCPIVSVTLTNTGGNTLTWTGSGTGAPFGIVVGTTCGSPSGSLAAGSSCIWALSVIPTIPLGPVAGTFSISGDNTGNGTDTINLSATIVSIAPNTPSFAGGVQIAKEKWDAKLVYPAYSLRTLYRSPWRVDSESVVDAVSDHGYSRLHW